MTGDFATASFGPLGATTTASRSLYAAVRDLAAGNGDQWPSIDPGTFHGDAVEFLTAYAGGGGRYAYMDTLASGEVKPDPHTQWTALCDRAPALSRPDEFMIWIYDQVPNVIYTSEDDEIQSILSGWLDGVRGSYLKGSTATTLALYDLVYPITRHISALSRRAFYEHDTPGIPYLAEVIDHVFLPSHEDFLGMTLMNFGDPEVVKEIVLDRHEEPNFDDLDDDEEGDSEDLVGVPLAGSGSSRFATQAPLAPSVRARRFGWAGLGPSGDDPSRVHQPAAGGPPDRRVGSAARSSTRPLRGRDSVGCSSIG
ncbi:hypothetical protein [Demequina litorisediminis]|uniref:Uncharacterized protein n=1 Tax=Demequina litorisediminis TaxID=1849022 RepID=A0ABQ6IKW1_9MICO|nr:hypothetical protein [Demequina litorisediminis]GMA37787.1 hypothetical protein GCM10025876_39910 [Demequina litorisediminis]